MAYRSFVGLLSVRVAVGLGLARAAMEGFGVGAAVGVGGSARLGVTLLVRGEVGWFFGEPVVGMAMRGLVCGGRGACGWLGLRRFCLVKARAGEVCLRFLWGE